MIKFLLKGILRDRQRSLLPVIVVSLGVFLTVVLNCWFTGILGDMIDMNAKFTTGHVKIMTKAYAENEQQIPNDLALLDVESLIDELQNNYPEMEWVKRIQFGGLIDVADENGETRVQGTASGLGIDLLSSGSKEVERLNIQKSIVRGRIPEKSGEVLISDDFAKKLEIGPGDEITLFGSTMYGSMCFHNFIVSGTVRFGISAMDKGSIIVDIADIQKALDMDDASGVILGYSSDNIYHDEATTLLKEEFNAKYKDDADPFAPVMLRLKDQNQLESMLEYMGNFTGILIFIFVFALSIVLWNTGLLGGLRRYNEFGVRLALGERKKHIYRTLILESILIGIIGSVIGTIIGLLASSYLQNQGLDVSQFTKNTSMMIPSTYRALITPNAYYIGFIPGLFAMVLGTALSGLGIYKRNTAMLFKELEV